MLMTAVATWDSVVPSLLTALKSKETGPTTPGAGVKVKEPSAPAGAVRLPALSGGGVTTTARLKVRGLPLPNESRPELAGTTTACPMGPSYVFEDTIGATAEAMGAEYWGGGG
jgi:hypothetical protein